MQASGKTLGVIMTLATTSMILVTYSTESTMILLGVVMLIPAILISARLVDKQLTWSEAVGLTLLILLSLSVGSFIGSIASRTLYSILMASSILIVTLIYSVFITMVYRH